MHMPHIVYGLENKSSGEICRVGGNPEFLKPFMDQLGLDASNYEIVKLALVRIEPGDKEDEFCFIYKKK